MKWLALYVLPNALAVRFEVFDRLGLLESGGAVRIGFCHYHSVEEVDRVRAISNRTTIPAFDAERFHVTGTPIQLQDGIRTQGGPGGRSAFLTRNGGMSYLTGDADRRLVWVDRSGAARAAIDGHGPTALILSRQSVPTLEGTSIVRVQFHLGTDVFASHGTPLRSPVDGTATAGACASAARPSSAGFRPSTTT